jgi:L-seryl-tRNA(Ser) seleniumtransferase
MGTGFRAIPAVEKVLQALGPLALPRPLVVALVRKNLAGLRTGREIPPLEEVVRSIRAGLMQLQSTRLQPLINGTGILVHTNLGRSPLSADAVETLTALAENYSNLEFDLAAGERGSRAGYVEIGLALLCRSEAAAVVNNCAAALLLILRHFTRKKPEVIISRGELVQIGGGFRIPEILEASGAQLREIGTTNQTSVSDYARAIGPNTGLILKVHRSNFFMGGFVESPSTEEIASLSRKARLPFVEDLGSGAVVSTDDAMGPEHEPTPAEILRCGVDLVTFSGDKLFGGPQAGIIAGRSKMVSQLKREPFFRALRCDKLVLGALQATVDSYLAGRAAEAIPTLAMLRLSEAELRARGEKIVAALESETLRATIGVGRGQVGGGTLPRSVIPSVTVDLVPSDMPLPEFAARLRAGSPPVVGYLSASRLKLDLRTIFPRQDEVVIAAVERAIGKNLILPALG